MRINWKLEAKEMYGAPINTAGTRHVRDPREGVVIGEVAPPYVFLAEERGLGPHRGVNER